MSLSASSMATSSSSGCIGGGTGGPVEDSGKASALTKGTVAPIELSPIVDVGFLFGEFLSLE